MAAFALFGLLSYLCGAIPFGLIVAKARGIDIRTRGSGNIGATNVFRCVGKGWGILTFVCDFAKGCIPVLLFPWLAREWFDAGSGPGLSALCGCLAVVGHNWPVTLGFKGGKGVATTTGALLGLAPLAMLIGLLSWIAVFLAGRYVSLASMVAALIVPAAAWCLYARHGLLIPIVLTVLGAVAIWRHKTNIGRLLAGTENRFEFGRKKPGEAPGKGSAP